MEAAARRTPLSRFEQLRYAREVLQTEGRAVLALSERLDDAFCQAVASIYECPGNVMVSGMGKAGLVGQKIVATLSSTGSRSHFLHPAEAIHGDLGRIDSRDVLLVLSFSGETDEVVRLLPAFQKLASCIIAMTGNPSSTLAAQSNITLDLGRIREACRWGLAPSTSTTAMMALGDALALVVSRMRQFGPEDFARFHPGGSLGRKLARVEDVMRPLSECRVASHDQSIRDVFVQASRPGRRTGAIMLVNGSGILTGLFTDSDLARLLESKREAAIDQPIHQVMTRAPQTVTAGCRLNDAVERLAHRRISELPVVDSQGRPLGLIDITDVVSLLPSVAEESSSPASADTLPFSPTNRD